jgi:putative membrane protein
MQSQFTDMADPEIYDPECLWRSANPNEEEKVLMNTAPIFRSRIFRSTSAFTCGVLLTGVVALAQSNPGMAGQNQTPNSTANSPAMAGPNAPAVSSDPTNGMADKIFVKDAMQGGAAEVQLGKLAVEKSQSDDVKQFAQKMVDDHTKLNEQMMPIAAQLGVKQPDGPSKKDKELMAKLQGLSGQQFDDAYIKAMLKDHKKDNSDFMLEAQNGQNPDVKQAAQQGDQVIQQHLQMIQQIAQAHNIASNGKAKGD